MARTRKFKETIIIKVIVVILIYILITTLYTAVGIRIFESLPKFFNEAISMMLYQLLYSIINILFFGIWFLRDSRSNKNELVPRRGDFGVVPAICLVVGLYAGTITGNGLLLVTGVYDNGDFYNELTEIFAKAPLFLEILTVAIVAPITEELIFRGLIFKNLRRKYNFWLASIITTLIFVIAHGNVYQGLAIFPISMFFAYLYERFGKIWVPMVAHIWNNLLATIMGRMISQDVQMEEIGVGMPEELLPIMMVAVGGIIVIFGGTLLFLMSLCIYKSKYPKNLEKRKMTKPVPM